MTRKIFRTSLLVGLAALALSAGLFSWALVRHFTAKVYEELMVEVRLAAQGVRLGGRDYLEAVSSPARLTWIGGDGTVLFDTAAQAEGMDNHLDRPEIRDALSRGLGRDSRLSDTLSERTLYAALALEDGTVLRVASRQKSAAALLAALAPEAALIVAATALLSALRVPWPGGSSGPFWSWISAGRTSAGATRSLRPCCAACAPSRRPSGPRPTSCASAGRSSPPSLRT